MVIYISEVFESFHVHLLSGTRIYISLNPNLTKFDCILASIDLWTCLPVTEQKFQCVLSQTIQVHVEIILHQSD